MLYSEQLHPGLHIQQRQLSYNSEFMSNILHLPGEENCIADALSCPSAVHPSSTSSSASPSASTSAPQVQFTLSLAPVLISSPFPPGDQLRPASITAPVLQFNPCLLILPFKYCHFPTVILQSSAMSLPAPSAL